MLALAIEWSWPETPVAIAVTVLLAIGLRWVVIRALRKATDAAVSRAEERRSGKGAAILDASGKGTERYAARAATMGSLLLSITNATIAVLAILTVMAILNIPLTPLLASAGVGGVALGFGAQSLVKDYLSGIFMIVEDQYGVGDLIDVGEVTGTVEDIGLRVTRLRDPQGQIWYVRNGEIVRVGNQSQGYSTALIDIPVDPSENVDAVIGHLETVAADVYADDNWNQVLLEEPTVAGVQQIAAGSVTLRIIAKTRPNEQWGVHRAILDRSLQVLKDAGIKGPQVLPGVPTAPPS